MDERPRFSDFLVLQTMRGLVEKKFLGKKFIRVAPMLSVSAFLFENSALLGSAYRDRLDKFVIPFCAAEDNQMSSLLLEEGQRIAANQSNADSILQLFMVSAMRQEDSSASPEMWSKWLADKSNQRMTPEAAVQMGCIHSDVGVGYGAFYPNDLAELYEKSYASIDRESWREANRYGVVTEAEPPPFVPFANRQLDAVQEFMDFCREYFPEYVDQLTMRNT